MTGLESLLIPLALALALPIVMGLAGIVYLAVKYTPKIVRIFEDRPLFMPLKVAPTDDGELVGFPADDGVRLSGAYFRARTAARVGVLIYCHEFLSDLWSFQPYIDHLRDVGFDIFSFDFRNHGESESQPDYEPLQWVSDREVRDLRGALRYLRSRPDRDPAGYGLFGVSRGGTAALFAAADEPDVWGVITDGAFPTRGTMVPYIVRWAEIYVPAKWIRTIVPHWVYEILAWIARRRSERRLGCRFQNVESAVSRLAPRPWLMIHGLRDAYIGPEIARSLFAYGDGPKDLWLVSDAKHNRCRQTEPVAYAERVLAFLAAHAPRRPLARTPVAVPADPASVSLSHEVASVETSPIPG